GGRAAPRRRGVAGAEGYPGCRQARATFPAFRQEVPTFSRLRVPRPTMARPVWMFGFHRRWVRRWECQTDMPKPGPLPKPSRTLATGISYNAVGAEQTARRA